MGTIFVEGKPYEVRSDQSLLQACLSLGFNIPYFCWHPALGSVGACRQCAVKQFKDENDTRGKIVMSCMTPAAPGTRISIDDPEVKEFRRGVIEGLMLNHPHDCPVCDEGGECHLQDMTVMTGHTYRRTRFPKRTFHNQDLGPFLNHEMNRCIQCYRCVRFYREYAGGRDLHALGIRNRVYFGRHRDGTLESPFSGNLIEVCPTGVFTDKTLKVHYTRKWDLQFAPSICVHCGTGCNVSPGERYGELRRILNRYNGEVNGWFLCDRGRFSYEFVNSDRRLRAPSMREGDRRRPLARGEAVEWLASRAPGSVVGLGSPRASLEANFALRSLVGEERFFAGIPEEEMKLVSLMVGILDRLPTVSLREVEQADAVLVLGEDLIHAAPRLALAVRQASRNGPAKAAIKAKIPLWLDHAVREIAQREHGPIFLAAPECQGLEDAAENLPLAPDDVARLGFAVAHELDSAAPDPDGLLTDIRDAARRIAAALSSAERPVVIAGPGCRSEAVIAAARNVVLALRKKNAHAAICFVSPECNTFGLAMMARRGIGSALEALRSGATTLVVLEGDVFTRLPRARAEELLDAAKSVVALDSMQTETTERAHLALPAGTFAESDGTLVNNEGRAQRFFQVFPAPESIQESWRWLRDWMRAQKRPEGGWESLDDVVAAIAAALPGLARISEAAPGHGFRIADTRVAREPFRFSGRTAMHADRTVHEPKPNDDPDAPLGFTMEGYQLPPPGALVPFFWWPGWNSMQSAPKFQEEVGGPLRGGDPGARLFTPFGEEQQGYLGRIPAAFAPRADEWLLVPLPRIFGSDELSRNAPAIASRVPAPALLLGREDAERARIADGEIARVRSGAVDIALTVRVGEGIPRGVAGLPIVSSTFSALPLPAWGRIERTP